MTDLEAMYLQGVPPTVLHEEARIQQQHRELEIGAMEFLFSARCVEEGPCFEQAKRSVIGRSTSLYNLKVEPCLQLLANHVPAAAKPPHQSGAQTHPDPHTRSLYLLGRRNP